MRGAPSFVGNNVMVTWIIIKGILHNRSLAEKVTSNNTVCVGTHTHTHTHTHKHTHTHTHTHTHEPQQFGYAAATQCSCRQCVQGHPHLSACCPLFFLPPAKPPSVIHLTSQSCHSSPPCASAFPVIISTANYNNQGQANATGLPTCLNTLFKLEL